MNTPHDSTKKDLDFELDFAELCSVLWSGRTIIVATIALFAVMSIIYSLLKTEIFRAETLLVPAVAEESSSPLAAQLGGAAALVGISLGQGSGDQIDAVLATLRSREFILKFIEDQNLRDQLSPGSDEDPTKDWQLYRMFSGMLDVSREDSGLIRVAIEWPDPQQAAEWVNEMVAVINAHEKARDVEEATNAIKYLQQQLQGTQLVEMQRVFYQLIESQTRVVMLADVRDEYVFRVIDPAVVPDQRVAPKRKVIAIVGTLIGGVLAVLFVVFRRFLFDRQIFSRPIMGDRRLP